MTTSAQDYFDQLRYLNEEITVTYERLNALQSRFDKEISEIYHDIERSDFDLTDGLQTTLRLKEVLQQRRAVKDQLVRIQPMYDLLRRNFRRVNDEYLRRSEKGDQVRSSLNSTMRIEEVFQRIEEESRSTELSLVNV
ncbi:hypothetical protein [Thalassobacillus hwangdonensis]|uniref:Uncharacterized protein n=1 Tax=Thalassobacillus hwangdonensis TaxID=546108 RepID=A0ABW3KZM7_9BACI